MLLRMQAPPPLVSVVLLAGTIACGTDPGRRSSATMEDQRRAIWRVDSAPMLSIGSEVRGPAYSFNRIVGLLQLHDGTLVVANAGSAEVRAFTPEGDHLWSFGQSGDGPGDFKNLSWIARMRGDTLIAYDNRGPTRYTIISPSGVLVRSLTADFRTRCGPPEPGLRGGLIVIADCPPRKSMSAGFHRTEKFLVIADPEKVTQTTIAEVPGDEQLVEEGGNWRYPVFGLSSVVAARDTIVLYGTGERFEIMVFAASGARLPSITLARPRVLVTDSMRSLYTDETNKVIQDFIRRRGGDVRAVREGGSPPVQVFRDTLPAYGKFLIDPEMHVWVNDYGIRNQPARRWTVLTLSGDLVSEVLAPPGLRVTEIGRDYLLGVARDSDDVESVRLYRLRKVAIPQEQ